MQLQCRPHGLVLFVIHRFSGSELRNSQESESLQSLLHELGNESPDASERLIAAAEKRLLHLTRRMFHRFAQLRRWEQTDDVFQNAMVRFHASLQAVRPDSPKRFYGLAVTQIRRTLIDLTRHHFGPQGPAAHHQSDLVTGGVKHVNVSSAIIGQNGPESNEAWAAFHESVEQLPEADREVFQLIWYGGLEQAAVAEVLGVSLSTVQRRWYRARNRLAIVLAPFHSHADQRDADE